MIRLTASSLLQQAIFFFLITAPPTDVVKSADESVVCTLESSADGIFHIHSVLNCWIETDENVGIHKPS